MTKCKMRRISPKVKDFINAIAFTFGRKVTRHGAGALAWGVHRMGSLNVSELPAGAGLAETGGWMFERIHNEPGLVRLHLRGGLDGEASRAMREGFSALASVEAREVVIDLSNVTHLDGSGVGAISFLFKRLAARGRRLTLAGVGGQPLAMLRHLGLARALGLEEERKGFFLALPGLAWAR